MNDRRSEEKFDDKFIVLAVDDRDANLIALRALFSQTPDIELVEATSGEEALMITLQRNIHLILLDVNMPGMDGFETAEHLQAVERTRDIPIVFLSATAKAEVFMQRGYNLGAVDYLAKPIEDNLLINRVRLYQRLYQGHRALQANLETLRTAQERLLQTEKLAALNPMVIAVAHELNTPIGNCQLMVSTMREETAEIVRRWESGTNLRRTELEAYLRSNVEGTALLDKALTSAAHVVGRFKEMAVREHSWARSRFQLREPVNLAVSTIANRINMPGLEIIQNIPNGLPMDSFNSALAQVIDELLSNSLLHGFEGRGSGKISIEALLDSGGDQVLLSYIDNGAGMSAETLAKAFDPFYTTRFGQGRSGLGLSICYNIVAGLLGGEIGIRSAPGEGTEFSISLPLNAPVRDRNTQSGILT
ncbi:MAG TPA: hybrid sensor histidine kinase/response regulator [Burkholderiaceae bacterium]|jgi:signal transduction histidine kinase